MDLEISPDNRFVAAYTNNNQARKNCFFHSRMLYMEQPLCHPFILSFWHLLLCLDMSRTLTQGYLLLLL